MDHLHEGKCAPSEDRHCGQCISRCLTCTGARRSIAFTFRMWRSPLLALFN